MLYLESMSVNFQVAPFGFLLRQAEEQVAPSKARKPQSQESQISQKKSINALMGTNMNVVNEVSLRGAC